VDDVFNLADFRKEGNGEYGGSTPWHSSGPYSFKGKPGKDCWLCNHCGEGGNAYQAVALMEGIVKDCSNVHRMTNDQINQTNIATTKHMWGMIIMEILIDLEKINKKCIGMIYNPEAKTIFDQDKDEIVCMLDRFLWKTKMTNPSIACLGWDLQ
jgi:hypothetical protein